jgi:5-methyltetrahydropteroyltriglutamate--homocysteine methyltransferase
MDARDDFAADKITRADLTNIEDECIQAAVAMQERVGISAITDGEFRKRGWREFLYDKCSGFGPETVERDFPFTLFDGTAMPLRPEPKIMTKLQRREPLSANDFSALQKMTGKPIKANLPTPSVTHCFIGDSAFDRTAYADREQLMEGLARIMREEIADLAARGCTYLQMDEVPLAVICDPKNMEVIQRRGDDPDELIDLYIYAINSSLRDRPATMTVCVHMCRGNAGHGMGKRRVRAHRRPHVQSAECRRLFPGIRHAARGRLWAFTSSPEAQESCTRIDDNQGPRSRERRFVEAPD